MPLEKKKTVIFIVGPTAIGKTALAVNIAKNINGEIISCDSMQVYKGMHILSQAPSPRQTKKIRYHLIKFLNPKDEYSAAQFVKHAERLMRDVIRRKKVPVAAGGSGLYVKGLIDGLFPSPEANLGFRKKMHGLAGRYGSKYLYKKLQAKDPMAAHLIHQNDTRRIIRALEIRHTTGRTMTELKNSTKGIADVYNIKVFGLTAPRDVIYSNINDRVDDMIKAGAPKEVKKIYKKDLSKTARAIIGLEELTGFLYGEYDLETAKELIKRNTRRFAKRQLTWFRADKRIRWFDISRYKQEDIVRRIVRVTQGHHVTKSPGHNVTKSPRHT